MARTKSSKPVTSRKPKPRARPATSRKPVSSRKPTPATSRKPVSTVSAKPRPRDPFTKLVKDMEGYYREAEEEADYGPGGVNLRARDHFASVLSKLNWEQQDYAQKPEPLLAALAASYPAGAVGRAMEYLWTTSEGRASHGGYPSVDHFVEAFSKQHPTEEEIQWFGGFLLSFADLPPIHIPYLIYGWASSSDYLGSLGAWAKAASHLYQTRKEAKQRKGSW